MVDRTRYRRRYRIVKEWRPPIIARVPIPMELRVDQMIRSLVHDDDLPVINRTYGFLLSNLIQRTYARQQVHSGHKWITWPISPTGYKRWEYNNVAISAGESYTLMWHMGRGQLYYCAFAVDSPKFKVNIWLNDIVMHEITLENVYNYLGGGDESLGIKILKWDTTNNIYSAIITKVPKFDGSFGIELWNVDSADHNLLYSHACLFKHEVDYNPEKVKYE